MWHVGHNPQNTASSKTDSQSLIPSPHKVSGTGSNPSFQRASQVIYASYCLLFGILSWDVAQIVPLRY